MKAVLCVTVFLLGQAAGFSHDTAYTALRVLGRGGHESALNRVIQVEGKQGEPQPEVWRILLDDPAARGGVREVEVSRGRIISEHTPVRSYVGSSATVVMDFKRLNLDSEGAFTIATQEATKHNTGFDSVDYVLRSDEQTNSPVWVLRLLDTTNSNVGTIYISADNGAILHTDGFDGARHAADDNRGQPDYVKAPHVERHTGEINDEDDTSSGRGIGHEINKGIHRLGANFQEFFTGKRTWDRNFRDEP